jgi:hypothetical protein
MPLSGLGQMHSVNMSLVESHCMYTVFPELANCFSQYYRFLSIGTKALVPSDFISFTGRFYQHQTIIWSDKLFVKILGLSIT